MRREGAVTGADAGIETNGETEAKAEVEDFVFKTLSLDAGTGFKATLCAASTLVNAFLLIFWGVEKGVVEPAEFFDDATELISETIFTSAFT